MEKLFEKLNRIQPDFDFDDLIELPAENDMQVFSLVRDASAEGTATRSGIQTNSLQSAVDNHAHAIDKSAIAKSTGMSTLLQYQGNH